MRDRRTAWTGIAIAMVAGVSFSALAACGFDHAAELGGDAGTPDAAIAPDASTSFPACAQFAGAAAMVPAHVVSTLAAADVVAPSQCATIDAPYGVESAGPDRVTRIDGLVAGQTYVVHLSSAADLSFYVVTGCSTATGPASAECLLFEDASSGSTEVGSFVATGGQAYVVVDYYQSSAPADGSFTLDVYARQCTSAAQCSGDTPACDDGKCVACVTSFDCHDPAMPVCDPTTQVCLSGVNSCTSDDAGEDGNDGPAGANPLVPDAGGACGYTGEICSNPSSEADFATFTVDSIGETWELGLAWSGNRDLVLAVYDATGTVLGASLWEQPEQVRLTYLPPGTYYTRVTEFTSHPDSTAVSYTLSATRTLGAGCATADDCAATYRNQVFRGACTAGACIAIDGAGAVPQGGACDSESDCAAGLSCPSFFFVEDAATREACEPGCATDQDCAALGAGYVCTTYLATNFCVQACTDDDQCPTDLEAEPASGPWARLSCDVSTGRCVE